MANRKSALKRIRTSEKRHLRNMAVKSETRTFVKKARTSIGAGAEDAQAELVAAISSLDRAARKGVIHANNAARRKSRLMKAFNISLNPPVVETAAPAKKAPAKSRTATRRKKS
jgi:small subunit ribosomal protein S20